MSAGQQPLGRRGVVGGQYGQAGLLCGEREDPAGGFGELAAVADAGQLAASQEVSVGAC